MCKTLFRVEKNRVYSQNNKSSVRRYSKVAFVIFALPILPFKQNLRKALPRRFESPVKHLRWGVLREKLTFSQLF